MMVNSMIFTLIFFIFVRSCFSISNNVEEESSNIYDELKDADVSKDKIGDTVVKWLARERIAHEKTKKEKYDAENDKTNSDRVIGAVAGRGAVESLYVTYVKGYLPTKQPGVPYTKLEMDKAYTDFFNDQENELAQALLKELPNWKNTDLAITIRKIYGKLSYADHSLFHTLKKMHNLNQVIEYIKAIGASLSDSDLVVVEKIATVLLEYDEFYTLPTTVNTAPTSKPGTK